MSYFVSVEPTSERKNGYVVHKCVCSCGNVCYKIAVPNDAIIVMKDAIKNIEMIKDPKEKYKYSFKGLLGFVDTRHRDLYNSNERKMFCSQFVARMFATAGMKLFGDKKDYEIRPYDFARNKNFKYCYRGMIKNYDPRRVR